jgi:hypothetical protein
LGQENQTGRAVAISRGTVIRQEALVAMFRASMAHNQHGRLARDHARAVSA